MLQYAASLSKKLGRRCASTENIVCSSFGVRHFEKKAITTEGSFRTEVIQLSLRNYWSLSKQKIRNVFLLEIPFKRALASCLSCNRCYLYQKLNDKRSRSYIDDQAEVLHSFRWYSVVSCQSAADVGSAWGCYYRFCHDLAKWFWEMLSFTELLVLMDYSDNGTDGAWGSALHCHKMGHHVGTAAA